MSRLRAGATYLVAMPLVCGLAIVAEFLAIEAVNALPGHGPDWLGWPINIVPAMAVGAAAYAGLALALRRRRAMAAGAVDHLIRASPLYCVAALLGALLTANFRSREFWLIGHGGIIADLGVRRIVNGSDA